MALTNKLSAIGDAVRSKTGKTEKLTLDAMATEINNIKAGGGDGSKVVDGSATSFSDENITKLKDYAFYGCNSLATIDTPNVTSVGENAYKGCGVKKIDLPLLTTDFHYKAFSNLPQVEEINIPKAIKSKNTYEQDYDGSVGDVQRFNDNPKLKRLNIDSLEMLGSCAHDSSIEVLDLSENIRVIDNLGGKYTDNTGYTTYPGTFQGCTYLTALILRNPKGVKLTGYEQLFDNSPLNNDYRGVQGNWRGKGYVYVPKAILSSKYQNGANWNNQHYSLYRAIEDYPEICGGVQ